LAPRKNDSGIDSAYSIQKDIDEDDMMNGRLMGTSRPLDRSLKKLKPKDEGVPGEGRKDAPKSQQDKIDGRRIFLAQGTGFSGLLVKIFIPMINIYIKRDTTAIFVTKQRQRWC
jgi:hypothetical protein